MISKELHDKVVDIPGGDGWFHSAGQAMFVDIAKIAKVYPLAAKGGVLKWGQRSQTALYGEIRAGFAEIEKVMLEKTDFEAFKAQVIAWAQKYMKLCKKYQAWAKKRK